MITKVLNKYIDLSKVVGIGLINTINIDGENYHIEIDFQLFEKTMIISLGDDDYQTSEEKAQVKEAYQELLKLWTSLINKPVETTNEQPKQYKDLLEWLKKDNDEQPNIFTGNRFFKSNNGGFTIMLKPDGTYEVDYEFS